MAEKPSSRRKRSAAASKGERSTSASDFPDRIFAIASPQSVGASLFTPGVLPDASTVGNFVSEPQVIERAVHLLADAGFEVLQANELMINIAGPRDLFESAFDTTLVAEERTTRKSGDIEDEATFIDSTDTDVSGLCTTTGTRFEEVLEGIAIEEPAYPAAPNAFPPPVDYFKLDVPADISLACNADKAHRAGITGRGVVVAMVDTGWQTHPFFTERGYRVDPTVLGPGTADAGVDENGHGSGESANIFATAPDVTLKPVKAATASGALVNLTAAFNAAVALNPAIVSNSWTSDVQFGPLSAALQARAAAVAAAWAGGVIVVFAAGNGHWGFPGQHPDVISVGGVDIAQNGDLRASDYASGFLSNIYPGRRVPDLSGIVGMRPKAMNIMLPLPPGSAIDTGNAGGSHPNGDETANNDGWAAFSGTSAACPQVAGVCALIKQACSRLTPAQVRGILMSTARDVTTGTNHPVFGNAATAGPDLATGNGLVDAHKAVLLAKVRCLKTPISPLLPSIPLQPVQPALPLAPFAPALPFRPLVPTLPLQPVQPALPFRPLTPVQPFAPLAPALPVRPFAPLPPLSPVGPDPGPFARPSLSDEDIEALERLIIESDFPES
jgi:subtilisin family serine protease